MDANIYLPLLSLLTLGAAIVFAVLSARAVKHRKANDDAPKSTLAADKDSHGKPVDV